VFALTSFPDHLIPKMRAFVVTAFMRSRLATTA
jgi:hypothetical protein